MKIAYNPKTAAVITTATAANDDILFDLNAKKVWAKGLRMGADWADISSKPSSLKNPYALTISLNGTSQGPYDGSAAKSINITPSSIGAAVSNHSHDYLVVNAADDKSFNSAYHNFQVLYAGGGNRITGKPANVDAFGLFKFRVAGGWSGQMLLANGGSLYIRSNEDAKITNTLAWKTILDSSNYSGILDSRYYTESEVNSLLSNKLNTSDFNWTNLPDKLVAGNEFNIVNAGFKEGMWFNYLPINDRSKTATITGYHFGNGATGYTSIKASGFIKNGSNSNYVLLGDGGHKLESSLNVASAGSASNLTVHQYLSNTNTTWFPLIWGGGSHNNTSDSTGAVYKSYDKLSWQTSSQTLYATHLKTTDLNTQTAFFHPDNDSTLKIYSGRTQDAVSDGHIGLQTSIDGTDGQTHAYPTQCGSRCVLALQPRGGSVYIGNMPNGGNGRKLNVNGDIGLFNVGSIRDLTIGGGIYWDPHAESASDNSDAASITVVRAGVAGGTTLVLSQYNDANDTIQFKTNDAARLYHNNNFILTSKDTKVTSGKGYIDNTEITQVNNADKVDNRHAISTTPNTGIIYKAAIYTSSSLTSYWVRLASISSISQNEEFIATIHVQSGHSNPGRSAILLVYLRGGVSSFISKSFKICCNSNYDPNRFRLYYKDSDKTSEIWYQTTGQWDGIITTVISQSSEGSLYERLTLYSERITEVQTPSMSTYLSAQVSTITDNISGNAATATNADKVDGYHASSLWRSDGATWNPGTNVSLNASANNQEWSFDIRRNGYTGCYWHVWDSALNSMLKVNADNGKVYAPYNFVGNLEGNASSSSKWLTARTFTIGNTAKNVDGSGNVSWSLSEIGVRDTWRTVQVNGTSIGNNTLNLCGSTYIGLTNVNGKVTFSLVGSDTTANQAILSNGTANGWTLKTLNIANWDTAYNLRHSHDNKSVLDGITSGLVTNWNTAYNFVSSITGTDTDKVINKWDEIVNFLAGITEDNKLNTLLNSKLSIQQLSAKDILTTKTNNALFWVDTKGNASTITTGPFTDHPYALLSVTNYNQNAENHKFFYRSRLAFSSAGDIKVASCHHENEYKQDETWYNVLTSKNSGINGSTIKLNGTSITVYSRGDADGRYVKKTGDSMTGALNFANNTWNNVGDDVAIGDHNVAGCLGIKGLNAGPGLAFYNSSNTLLSKLVGTANQFQRVSGDNNTYNILDNSTTHINDNTITINGTSLTVSKSDHNHDNKYITNITTTVNKLTFTKNGANINKDITVNKVLSKGSLTNIADEDNTTKADSGLFIYSSYSQKIGTNNYSSVLSINTGGTIQIAGDWGDDWTRNLYWRSQSDRAVASYPWKPWRTILDNINSYVTNGKGFINGSEITQVSNATNADKLDGYHANGLLTALSNSNRGISLTVGGTTKSLSNISVGDADTVDGYHISDESRQVYKNSYTVDNPASAWILIKFPAYNAVNEIITISGYGSNRQAHCEVHCGSRFQGIWGYQSDYNGIVVDRIRWKEVDSGKFAIVALINGGITTLTIKATNSLEISKTTEDTKAFTITANFFSIGGVFYGNAASATKVIVNQHTANDINYPLVWSNQSNTSSATENQLHKSWQDLYYNPKNKRLFVGGSISTVNINATGTVTSAGFKHSAVTKNADQYVLTADGGYTFLNQTSNELAHEFDVDITVTTEWQDIDGFYGGSQSFLTQPGTYIVQVYYTTNSANSMYEGYFSGIMSWYTGTTNSNNADEIVLHRVGHAYANTIYLRTRESLKDDPHPYTKLQISANSDLKQHKYKFKFKRIC